MSGLRRRLVAATLAGAALLAAPVAPGAAAPAGYSAARAALAADGHQIEQLIRAGSAARIHARFTPAYARTIPRTQVEKTLHDTLAVAPIGKRLGETLLPAARDRRIYIADYRWGARTLALQISFDRHGAIAGIALNPRKPLPPDPNAGRLPRARLSLPFTGEWWAFWGGSTERENYHVVAPDQRHAYDLLAWQDGSTHRGTGTRNTDYYAWGRQILAPADARVVEAVDGVRDNRPQVEVQNLSAPAGNHVVLDLGHGEYALLAHLRRGSVRVSEGQRVRRGQLLGRAGNSGNSSEPHLHFHLQDAAELFGEAKGIPLAFSDYRADGVRIMRGAPLQGQFLRPGQDARAS